VCRVDWLVTGSGALRCILRLNESPPQRLAWPSAADSMLRARLELQRQHEVWLGQAISSRAELWRHDTGTTVMENAHVNPSAVDP
jgi:hypothetical protein